MDEITVKQQYAIAVNNLLEVMDAMTQDDINQLSGRVVGLRDTNKFRCHLEMLTRDEIMESRRKLASAIAAEKWVEGFVFAIQIMTLFV